MPLNGAPFDGASPDGAPFDGASPDGAATETSGAATPRDESFAVVVIGGGPAGALCAIRLASRGVRTLVVDKANFPRGKVCGCCLNLAAAAALDDCGLGDLPSRLGGVPLVRWVAKGGGRSVQSALPGGWSLSRERMDAELLAAAAAAGAVVRQGTQATVAEVSGDGVWIRLRSDAAAHGSARSPVRSSVRASVAVIATGLAGGGLERWLPWRQRPAGPLGAGVVIADDREEIPPGVIYMACGRDGYVGAVRLEDGRLSLAAALRAPGRRPRSGSDRRRGPTSAMGLAPGGLALAQRMEAILCEGGLAGIRLDPAAVAATPRMRRSRRVGHGRLIAIGDAAGYVAPFTGEGMAWAMHSGRAAADCIVQALPSDGPSLGRRWRRQHARMCFGRQLPCRGLALLLAYDAGRRTLFGAMRRAPWMTRAVVRYLNHA